MLLFKRVNKTLLLLPIIFWFVSGASIGFAQLKIESVDPTLGVISQETEVTLMGTGFDANTRVSISLDSGAQRQIIKTLEDITGNNLIIKDSIGYVNQGMYFKIYNLTDPINPHLLSWVRLSNSVSQESGLAVSGTKAYLPYYDRAKNDYGIRVVDISNPATPQIIGSVAVFENMPFGYEISDLAVWGDMVYAATGDGGLYIIDVSVPENPQVVKSVEIETSLWAEGVAATENTVYVVGGYGFWIIDVSDPATASITGSVLFNYKASYRVQVSENRAYLATTDGLKVIDISNHSNPYEIGSLDSSWGWDIFLKDDIAYLIDDTGLQIINISVPNNPELIGTIFTKGYTVAVDGDMGYVLGNESLKIIDVSNPMLSVVIGALDTPGWANEIAVEGEMVYVADRYYLQVITVADPYNPEILGSVNIGDMAEDIIVEGTTVFLANSSNGNTEDDIGLDIIDVSNLANPQRIGWVDTPGGGPNSTAGGANGIFYSQNTIYMADGYSGLQIIDVSDLENPVIIGAVDTPGMALAVTVEAGYAYVADQIEGLQIINISNPGNPMITTSVKGWSVSDVTVYGDTLYATTSNGLKTYNISSPGNPLLLGTLEGTFSDINITGTLAYAIGDRKIHVVDIAVPSDTRLIASIDLPGSGGGVAVLDDLAYVAMGKTGVLILPVPVEITLVSVYSSTSISFTVLNPLLAGHYTLRVFNAAESDELVGAISFVEFHEYEIQQQKKAIIVAGGGPYPGNNLWEATRICANYAYRSLLYQGYKKENIYYLNPENIDVDGNGKFDDVDADTTYSNLSWAINTWVQDWENPASDLLLYMVDHGGDSTFRLNEYSLFTAEELDGWLDDLQSAMAGKLIFIYDACQSGTFVSKLLPPEDKERIVITSASNETAYFIVRGGLSFSYQFWSNIYGGAELYDAFVFGKNMIMDKQSPIIEANGNGIGNEKEDRTLADNIVIGRGYVPASDIPYIQSISVDGTSVATIQAVGVIDSDGIDRVWAVITSPGFAPESPDTPVTDLPIVEMTDPDNDNTYEGQYNDLTINGTYRIDVFAMDTQGNMSLPRSTSISNDSGIDIYEDDDSLENANVIVPQLGWETLYEKYTQRHNFHDEGDEDCVRFYGIAGKSYEIVTSDLEENCDTVIMLYDENGDPVLETPWDDYGPGENELISWLCPSEGLYYIMLKQYDPSVYGQGTAYGLKIYHPEGGVPGELIGLVFNSFGVGIGNAVLKSNLGNGTAVTNNDGSYMMVLPSGTHTITVTAAGYVEKTWSGVVIEAEGVTDLNVEMVLANQLDSDDDGIPDGEDLCPGHDDAVDIDNDGIPDGCDTLIDSDGDGFADTEDLCPGHDDSVDVDNDGIPDGCDNLIDSSENGCTDPNDADTDDDGILDADEDADHDGIVSPGETDPCDSDTDGDGIQDGTESGYTLADIGADTDQSFFQPDEDPYSTTDPTDEDTDGDGSLDGDEDANYNGSFEDGETDPINSGNLDDNLSRTAVTGTVTYNGTPVTAMVLANGKYMFTSGGEGRFDLTDVPLDAYGEITVYAFCSGLAPYKIILFAGAYNLEIEMSKNEGGKQLNVSIDDVSESSTKPGWYDISGTIENDSGTPLIAMVLANGQYMFTSNPVGEFNLTVPLDGIGQIKLFGFCSGLLPYKIVGDPITLGQ